MSTVRVVVKQKPERDTEALERFAGNLTTLIAFVLALVICVAVPSTYYTPLFLLAFTGLVDRHVHRRLTRNCA